MMKEDYSSVAAEDEYDVEHNSDSESVSTQSSSDAVLEREVVMGSKGRLWAVLCSGAIVACSLYSLASISMVLSNKYILSTMHFKYDMVLMFVQNLMALVLLRFGRRMGWFEFEDFDAEKARAWLPLNFLFVLMLATGFFSLNLLSVPMVTIFKNSSNVLVTIGDYFLYGQTVSRGIVACLVIMVSAAVFAALNDLSLQPLGIMWALANCCASSAYVLYMPTAMKKTNLSSCGKVYYNCALSLPLIVVLDLFTTDHFRQFFFDTEAQAEYMDPWVIGMIFFSGFVGFAISFTSFNLVRKTSPTTYSMVGSMNKIPLSIIGVVLFHTKLTQKSGVFISASLLAGILYAYTKARDNNSNKQEQRPPPMYRKKESSRGAFKV
mmetsp:Transcript_13474/g.24117  ORF Transcript_13474/g.24117 Transcript_13474/m.24117 type:complete len:379 (-) Transcript_13474:3790-4926(-)